MATKNKGAGQGFSRRFSGVAILAIVVLLQGMLFAGLACYTNQLTGKRGLVLVPDSTMNDMGAQAFREVKSQARVSTDPQMTQLTRTTAMRVAKATDANYPWEFMLVEQNEANAFALPGGKIVVYTGILPAAQTEAGLAFVLGHEVGHVVARHGAQRVSQQILAQGALIAVSEFTLRENPNRDLILAGLGMGAQVGVMLPFSRHHESEADYMGIIYMARAGYDPREAPQFWQRMSHGSGAPPEFLSTHPSSAHRSADLNAVMDVALAEYQKAPKKYGVGARFK